MSGEISVVHGYNCGQVPLEHVLPLLLPYVLAVVGTCAGFGSPFLLEVGAGDDIGRSEL